MPNQEMKPPPSVLKTSIVALLLSVVAYFWFAKQQVSSGSRISGNDIPVIDISALRSSVRSVGSPASPGEDVSRKAKLVGDKIIKACRDVGFFYISGHEVSVRLQDRLERASRKFFSRDEDVKNRIQMRFGGKAWRGYFKVGEELTSGRPDLKEGIYFGSELDSTEVKPLHGPNLWPHTGKALSASTFEFSREDAEFKSLVLEYIDEMTALGHDLMRGVAIGLGLRPSFFRETIMKDPLILFRIFNYPDVSPWIKKYADQEAELRRKLFVAAAEKNSSAVQEIERQIQSFKLPEWSVGEHTDYGVLTLLKQDQSGGLQVRRPDGVWIDAPPLPNTFVVNIGDMLEKMTGGVLRSTPHRVRNPASSDRISFPFFFDPDFDALVSSIVDLSPKLRAIVAKRHRARAVKTSSSSSSSNADEAAAGSAGDEEAGAPRGASADAAPTGASAAATTDTRTYARWDGKRVGLEGPPIRYGDWVMEKISRVFPFLFEAQEMSSKTATKGTASPSTATDIAS